MVNSTSSYKFHFGELVHLYNEQSKDCTFLEPFNCKGSIQISNLSEGLQARLCDCSGDNEIEMYGHTHNDFHKLHYTLIFFIDNDRGNTHDKKIILKEKLHWDTIFISSKSNYQLNISPEARGQFLSITFSKKWLDNNILNDALISVSLKEKLRKINSKPMISFMEKEEKKFINELLNAPFKKSFGSFFIKSSVLKIISDFFYKIKDTKVDCTSNVCLETSIKEVEELLSNNVATRMPNLKELVSKYSISESTLKRHFKKKYGTNMSTYFISRKIEYAHQLVNERKMSFIDAAAFVGYEKVDDFIALTQSNQRELSVAADVAALQ